MKRLLALLVLTAATAFAGGIRLFNPAEQPLAAVVVCDGVATRQAIAPNEIVDFAGNDCRAEVAPPLFAVRTESVDGDDVQTLQAAATAECPTPALSFPLTGCRFGSAIAMVTPVDGATYSWTIEGGTLLSGAGTERVLIAIGSGPTVKVTATISSPSCGVQNAAGIMALRDPFRVKLAVPGGGAAGEPRTITWTYENGAPVTQLLSGSDFAAPIALPPSARSYTYTPSMFGFKDVFLDASAAPPPAGRTRAAGRGTAAASNCTSVHAQARYHVDCTTPIVKIEAPAGTGVGLAFTARVTLAPGSTAAWTIANGTPSTATGESVTIQPAGAAPVEISVTVSVDTCSATASARVFVDSSLGCATPPSAKLTLASSECDKAVIAVSLTGVPPFAGTWSDGQPFSASDRTAERTITAPGDYTIKNFRDALCAGAASNSVKYAPTPTATITTNGANCLSSGAEAVAILTFTGTPPFLGEWSDSVAFNTTSSRLERKITAPADLTLKWFQDANCPGTVSGHAGFGEQGTASVKLSSPANGCLMIGDPLMPFATAAVDLTGTPPFTVVWADGVEQSTLTSPALRAFAPPAGASYPLAIRSARDAYCDLKIVNASTSVAVTKYPAISAPATVCPGVAYNASVPAATPTPVTWRIEHGAINGGQGAQTVTFTPSSSERTSVTLYADVADPATCTATASRTLKIPPGATPVTLSVSPKTINLGESVTITMTWDPLTTKNAGVEIRGDMWVGGWLCVVGPTCSNQSQPLVRGTITITATGYNFCDALADSSASTTITVK